MRFAGYNIGATQYIAAQDLILTLAAQSKLPSELTELRQFLAPILCHSPKEQDEFATHFNQWVKQFPQTKFSSETETSPLSDVESELRTIKKGSTFWKWGLIAFAMVFISSIFVYWSDIINLFKFTQPDEIQPISLSLWDMLPSLQVGLTLLSPFLVLLLWQLWWWYRGQLFLAKQSTPALPDIRKLFIKETDDKFFKSVSLARTAQQLRKHISMPANLLDVDATVDKTIQAGGWFTPITGTIKIRPQYLALIDRTTFNDHQTQLINSLINQLVADEVLVTRYYFDTVPRRCYPDLSGFGNLTGLKPAPFTLPELAQHYPDHRLLVFSDGNGLVNPITGKVVNWIEQFSVWSQRVLFTLETPEQWGYREQILDGANFLILPANEEGLKGLVERINTGTWQPYPKPSDSFSKEFPEYLQERPRRWLEHHAPDTPVLTELLQQVRNFLGDKAYSWFNACAIYPELRWQLTLYLGEQLKSLSEERLAKLARLPWFRYGYMPDWLREQLIKELSLPKEHEIRTALYNRLLETSDKPLSDFNLEIAKSQQNTLSTLVQQLLPKWAKKVPKNSPLHDHVFMTFMGDKLAVKIPKILRNLFSQPEIPTKLSEDSHHETKLPSWLSLLWLILMQPITLHHRLKACGIESPDASIFKLWFAQDETRSIKRQYVKQFLLLLLVVMPLISWTIVYPLFDSMLGFPIDINFPYKVALFLGCMIGGMVGSIFGGVVVGIAGSIVGGVAGGVAMDMAVGVTFGIFGVGIISMAVGIAGGVVGVVVFGVKNIAFGMAVGITVGAVGMLVGMKFIAFGIVFGMIFDMVVRIIRVISGGIAGGVIRNLIGALVASLIFIAIGFFYEPKLLSSGEFKVILITVSMIFMLGYLRLLIYPIEALWQTICYTIQKTTNISTLRFVPVLYHNLSFLPHPFLARHIILGAETEPELAKKVIDACAFSPGQYQVGQVALEKIKELEQDRLQKQA